MGQEQLMPLRTERIGFHEYLRGRKYDFGRSSPAGWAFIARALGDPNLPDATIWAELRNYLQAQGEPPHTIEAARLVWKTYQRNAPHVDIYPAGRSFLQSRRRRAAVQRR